MRKALAEMPRRSSCTPDFSRQCKLTNPFSNKLNETYPPKRRLGCSETVPERWPMKIGLLTAWGVFSGHADFLEYLAPSRDWKWSSDSSISLQRSLIQAQLQMVLNQVESTRFGNGSLVAVLPSTAAVICSGLPGCYGQAQPVWREQLATTPMKVQACAHWNPSCRRLSAVAVVPSPWMTLDVGILFRSHALQTLKSCKYRSIHDVS